jgi:hypothetical protein
MTLEGLGRVAMRRREHARAAQLFREALQTAGTSLSSITLSILIRISRLFLETNLQEEAHRIITLVIQHPASNQEIVDKTQDQLVATALVREVKMRLLLWRILSTKLSAT